MRLKSRILKVLNVSVIIGVVLHILSVTFVFVLPKYLKVERQKISEEELLLLYFNYKLLFIFIMVMFLLLFAYSHLGNILKNNKIRFVVLLAIFGIFTIPTGFIGFAFHYIGMILYPIFMLLIFTLFYFLSETFLFKEKNKV